MSDQHSEAFLRVQSTLKEFREKLTELSNTDLSGVHVDQVWSWIPYVKDHLDFLVEQTAGVEDALCDTPPPVSKDGIKRITEKNPQ